MSTVPHPWRVIRQRDSTHGLEHDADGYVVAQGVVFEVHTARGAFDKNAAAGLALVC